MYVVLSEAKLPRNGYRYSQPTSRNPSPRLDESLTPNITTNRYVLRHPTHFPVTVVYTVKHKKKETKINSKN